MTSINLPSYVDISSNKITRISYDKGYKFLQKIEQNYFVKYLRNYNLDDSHMKYLADEIAESPSLIDVKLNLRYIFSKKFFL